jgi:hypothetical protein
MRDQPPLGRPVPRLVHPGSPTAILALPPPVGRVGAGRDGSLPALCRPGAVSLATRLCACVCVCPGRLRCPNTDPVSSRPAAPLGSATRATGVLPAYSMLTHAGNAQSKPPTTPNTPPPPRPTLPLHSGPTHTPPHTYTRAPMTGPPPTTTSECEHDGWGPAALCTHT